MASTQPLTIIPTEEMNASYMTFSSSSSFEEIGYHKGSNRMASRNYRIKKKKQEETMLQTILIADEVFQLIQTMIPEKIKYEYLQLQDEYIHLRKEIKTPKDQYRKRLLLKYFRKCTTNLRTSTMEFLFDQNCAIITSESYADALRQGHASLDYIMLMTRQVFKLLKGDVMVMQEDIEKTTFKVTVQSDVVISNLNLLPSLLNARLCNLIHTTSYGDPAFFQRMLRLVTTFHVTFGKEKITKVQVGLDEAILEQQLQQPKGCPGLLYIGNNSLQSSFEESYAHPYDNTKDNPTVLYTRLLGEIESKGNIQKRQYNEIQIYENVNIKKHRKEEENTSMSLSVSIEEKVKSPRVKIEPTGGSIDEEIMRHCLDQIDIDEFMPGHSDA